MNGHSDGVEYLNQMEIADRQKELQASIDEYIFLAGRIDHILDGHTAAVNAICGTRRPKGKRSEWENIPCPF